MRHRISVSIVVSIAVAIMMSAGAAWAHHNMPYLDMNKRITLTGTLTKLDWRNPHIEFALEAKGDQGQAESWVIESAAPNGFATRKIGKADFDNAIGQAFIMEVSPARDGSRIAIARKITFPDGRVVAIRP
jgi:hypothetical protein